MALGKWFLRIGLAISAIFAALSKTKERPQEKQTSSHQSSKKDYIDFVPSEPEPDINKNFTNDEGPYRDEGKVYPDSPRSPDGSA